MTRVVQLDPDDDVLSSAWDAFVGAQEQGTFFHLAKWARVLRDYGYESHYLLAIEGDDILGVLPLACVSRWFDRVMMSTPFCVHGGALTVSRDVEALLVQEALALSEQSRASHVEIRSEVAGFEQQSIFATFELPLHTDENENLRTIRNRQRAVVRKALARGMRTEITEDVAAFYPRYADSVSALGTPVFSERLLESVAHHFTGQFDVLSVVMDGAVLCSVLSYYDRGQVLPYYAAVTPEARRLGAIPLMYYHLMNHAASRGCSRFDFGRSPVGSGAWQFKRNFGATERLLTYSVRQLRGGAGNLNPNSLGARFASQLWQRLPRGVARKMGPRLAVYTV